MRRIIGIQGWLALAGIVGIGLGLRLQAAPAVSPLQIADTPESVMAAAKTPTSILDGYVNTATDVNRFLNRIATDRAFASQLFAAVKKGDRQTVQSLTMSTGVRGRVSVGDVKTDFFLDEEFEIPIIGKTVYVCLTNERFCKTESGDSGVVLR
jgi:hypothetical protein